MAIRLVSLPPLSGSRAGLRTLASRQRLAPRTIAILKQLRDL
jgi:hypothetical protein